MALSSPGIGSNLDVNGIISQLMALERRPLQALDQKEASYQAKLSAYGSVKGALSSLQASAQALTSPARFSALKASVADTSVLSASATGAAVAGTYSVEVQTLAQSQKLKSATFSDTTSTVGSGTITVQFGTYSGGSFTLNPDKAAKAITVAPGQNTLAGIREAINAADVGVSATIVNDGTGNRLVISSNDSGLANALKISVTDNDGNNTDATGLSKLAYDASTGGVTNLTQTVAAQNATLNIDGVAISKASNTINDAIEGVTLNLLKSNSGSTTTLTVSRDSSGVKSAIEGFVKAYTDTSKTLANLSAYDAKTKQAAILTGDSSVRSIQSQLRAIFNTGLATAGGGLTALSEIGLSFQADGTLKLDSTKLQKIIDDPSKDIATLFAAVGKPSDSLVSFVAAGKSTKGGSYGVNITQTATQGKAVGSQAAANTITAAVNDTLSVSLDGVAASVQVAAGTYSAASLAAEIQSKINGASALSSNDSSVVVTQAGGILTLTSGRYGSASSVSITGGTAATDLFGTAASTAGIDVAGTIASATATGSGQTLAATSGDANGLKLAIAGGATGDRGAVKFAQGYAVQFDQLLGKMLASDGLVAGRNEGITRSVKDIGTQREALTRRMDAIEKRYRAQFTALDIMISSMTKTSTFLEQQLANLPKANQ